MSESARFTPATNVAIGSSIRLQARIHTPSPMDLSFNNKTTRGARFRRELRNPSMLTVILLATVVLVIVLAPFAPKWISTTQDSFAAIAKQKEIQEASMSSIAAIIPSQISPWLAVQTNTMINAEGPLDWNVVSFRSGSCAPQNLSQLPAGKYSASIATACDTLDDIQLRYSRTCFLASNCNVPEVAKLEIRTAMDGVWEAFSDAGFVLPYDQLEQQVNP